MRTIGTAITLVCGILVIVGVFLPWISESTSILGFTVSFSKSGWSIIDASGWDISDFVLSDNIHALLVLIGGIVMTVCVLPALILSTLPVVRIATVLLGIVASLAALVAIGGAAWFIVDMMNSDAGSYIGYGIYLSAAAAFVGLILGSVCVARI